MGLLKCKLYKWITLGPLSGGLLLPIFFSITTSEWLCHSAYFIIICLHTFLTDALHTPYIDERKSSQNPNSWHVSILFSMLQLSNMTPTASSCQLPPIKAHSAAFLCLCLLLNLWQNARDDGWLSCPRKLWINRLWFSFGCSSFISINVSGFKVKILCSISPGYKTGF